jgi:hypothetical protein
MLTNGIRNQYQYLSLEKQAIEKSNYVCSTSSDRTTLFSAAPDGRNGKNLNVEASAANV